MKSPILSLMILATTLASLADAQPVTATGKPLFTFQSNVWTNLHHFLYVLGRARANQFDSRRLAVAGAPADTAGFDKLTDGERQVWDKAVAFYKNGLSDKDAVFDNDLIAITRAIATGGNSDSAAAGIPSDLGAVLDQAGPIYRKVWWQRHDRANQARIDELKPLLERYGSGIADLLARAWQQKWPDSGITVQMAAYANWAGAYSTTGGLIVVGSLNEDAKSTRGLEIVFHEAMHQWDDAMEERIKLALRRTGAKEYPNLSHSLIFYTAGFAVSQAIKDHRPYAEDMWSRGVFGPRAAFDAAWMPYLQGKGTMDESLQSLVVALNRPAR